MIETLLQVGLWYLEVGLLAGILMVLWSYRFHQRHGQPFTRKDLIGHFLIGFLLWFPVAMMWLVAIVLGYEGALPFSKR